MATNKLPDSTPPTPTLLGLPRELRDRIYRTLVPYVEVEFVKPESSRRRRVYNLFREIARKHVKNKDKTKDGLHSRFDANPAVDLMCTSKQLYQEVHQISSSAPIHLLLDLTEEVFHTTGLLTPSQVDRVDQISIRRDEDGHRQFSGFDGIYVLGLIFRNLKHIQVQDEARHKITILFIFEQKISQLLVLFDKNCTTLTDCEPPVPKYIRKLVQSRLDGMGCDRMKLRVDRTPGRHLGNLTYLPNPVDRWEDVMQYRRRSDFEARSTALFSIHVPIQIKVKNPRGDLVDHPVARGILSFKNGILSISEFEDLRKEVDQKWLTDLTQAIAEWQLANL